MQTHEHAGHTEGPGHHWEEPERVRDYVADMDRRQTERRDQFDLLVRLLPYTPDAPVQVLDLGAGHGAASGAVLAAFPASHAVLVDLSDEMMRIGTERLASFAGRFRYVRGDFGDGGLPDPTAIGGPFQAVISSLAIHHLAAPAIQRLYREIAARLVPGGCFFNLDSIAAPDDGVAEVYRRVEALDREARGEPESSRQAAAPGHAPERYPLAQHLDWLRECGFTQVDCYWKRLGTAIFGGFTARTG